MKTLLDTLQGGTKYLEQRGVEDARLNMEYLLAKVLQCERMDLYLDFDRPLAEEQLVPLRELLRCRGERQPLQHLLGEVEFHGRSFLSDSRGLIPRPETEELVGIILDRFAEGQPPSRVVDVGCGSGVIGLSLGLEWQDSNVFLVDISSQALALAEENAKRHIESHKRFQFIEADLLDGISGPFDLVVANLPYISTSELSDLEPELQYDPQLALEGGEKGIEIVERLIRQLPGKIAKGGVLALELGENQGALLSEVLTASEINHWDLVKDLAGTERFIVATA